MAKREEAAPARRPRNADLPGMDDRAIKPLEDIAESYADVRDRRIALNLEESNLKGAALKLMKKYDKQIYKHNGVEIIVTSGEEGIKVKVPKKGDGDDDDENVSIS